MDFIKPFKEFFDHPKWGMNWLLITVCVLIPLVGPVVLYGWMLTVLVCWLEGKQYPEFNFEKFVDYLKFGIWPFLIYFIYAMLVTVLIMFLFFAFMMAMIPTLDQQPNEEPPLAFFLALAGLYVAFPVAISVGSVIIYPAALRVGLKQNIGAALEFGPVFALFKKTILHLLIVQLVLTVMGIFMYLAGAVVLCFGAYFAMSLVMFVQAHLHFQVYKKFLDNGGEEIPIHPDLKAATEGPQLKAPPLPAG